MPARLVHRGMTRPGFGHEIRRRKRQRRQALTGRCAGTGAQIHLRRQSSCSELSLCRQTGCSRLGEIFSCRVGKPGDLASTGVETCAACLKKLPQGMTRRQEKAVCDLSAFDRGPQIASSQALRIGLLSCQPGVRQVKMDAPRPLRF